MKKLLPLLFLVTFAFPSFAQYEYLAIAGVTAGLSALKSHPQKPDEYVIRATYQGTTFAQKRTPANKLPNKGGPQITAVEQLLASDYAALQASSTVSILGADGENTLRAALAQLQAVRPQWSVVAYTDELDFYRQEERRRSFSRDELARKQAYQRQVRERSQRDSLERLALRRTELIDNTRRAVIAEMQAATDSTASARATVAEEAISEPVEAARTYATPRAAVVHKATARKVVVKVKRSTGPTVYYCASGNTVKYHASPTCRGLSRCGATVLPISMREATQSMDPCKWCY